MPDKVVKVKFYKKRNDNNKESKETLSHKDLQSTRKWLITGSFSNSFFLNNTFDKTNLSLLRKVVNQYPERICDLLDEAIENKLNDTTLIYTLVLLSNSNFRAKKIFKDYFNKIVVSPKDLFHFMELCKKERGFGKIIHESIHKWFRHYDIHKLERMFVEERSGFNWKSQDVMRMIKPKPIDKKEQLLFKWLAKGTISEDDKETYKINFPLIYTYESLKSLNGSNTGLLARSILKGAILKNGFRNNMIPGNVHRTPELYDYWFNYTEVNKDSLLPISQLPRYIHLVSSDTVNNLNMFLKSSTTKLSILTLLTLYTQMQDVVESANEIELLETIEEQLLEKVKHTHSKAIHIIDHSVGMFDEKMKEINATPAVASSVMIGVSKNVVNFDGELVGKRTPRAILEAEGYTKEYCKPKYNKIFETISNMESEIIFVWTNDKSFNKTLFYKNFRQWKIDNKKVMKLIIMNLTDIKQSTNFEFKEVYSLNRKTEQLVKYLKDGII